MKFYIVEEYTINNSNESERTAWTFDNEESAKAFFEYTKKELPAAFAREVRTATVGTSKKKTFIVDLSAIEADTKEDAQSGIYDYVGTLDSAEYTYSDYLKGEK